MICKHRALFLGRVFTFCLLSPDSLVYERVAPLPTSYKDSTPSHRGHGLFVHGVPFHHSRWYQVS